MASVLAVIFNHNDEFLLVLRPGELQHGSSVSGRPGQWCLPGGKIKVTETCEEAIVREVREEVGLAVSPIRRLADFGDQTYYHCGLSENSVIALNTRECANFAWLSRENLTSVGFISDFRRLQMVRLELGNVPATRTATTSSTTAGEEMLS
ncbi:MAG: NUDIX domain-containing protein [Planctomycetaceae bacterium]